MSASPSDPLERAQEEAEEREAPDPGQKVECVGHDVPASPKSASNEREMVAPAVRALCRIQAAGVRIA
jgi:hypothetical protein